MRKPKLLHVLYTFLPDLTGSSIRSSGVLSGQLAHGIRLAIVTSPFQPGWTEAAVEVFKDAPLYRAHRRGYPVVAEKGSSLAKRARKVQLFPAFVSLLIRIARQEQVTVLHAHSTFYCALAAYLAARRLGIPVVYEFRSVWEERGRSMGWVYRMQARLSRALETASLRMVDRVVTINEGLKQEIVSRGIDKEKVVVVPNAVEDELLQAGANIATPQRVRRFGYIGNFSAIEGLDLLISAFMKAFESQQDVELLFHGAGPFEPELRRLVQVAADPRIRVIGRFEREAVAQVYASVDCVVIPRRRSKITETVTPLKPLEAMAFKRLVAVSDVAGLVEVVGGEAHAVIFPADDEKKLVSSLQRIRAGDIPVVEMAERANSFVNQHRAWNSVAGKYLEVYAGLAVQKPVTDLHPRQ